jgi:hypothetical protein
MRKPDKRNSRAWAISDRSGFKFRMSEMVLDDGFLVHKSESDGQWSRKNHPLANMGMYLKDKIGDPFPVPNARPEQLFPVTSVPVVPVSPRLYYLNDAKTNTLYIDDAKTIDLYYINE